MRTIIDLPAEQIEALDALCRRDRISRAEAIRRAVAQHVRLHRGATTDQAFGLWRGRRIDGLTYQQRLRSEWDGDLTPTEPAKRRGAVRSAKPAKPTHVR